MNATLAHALLLTAGVLYMLLGFTVWSVLHLRHSARPVLLWAAGSFTCGLGVTLIALRISITMPDWLTYSTAAMFLYSSFLLRIVALRHEIDRPTPASAWWVVAVLSAGYWWAASVPALGPRAIYNFTVLSAGSGITAWHAAAVGRRFDSRSAKVLALFEALLAASLGFRALLMMAGSSPALGVAPSWDFGLMLALAFIAGLYGNLGYIGMVLERARASEARALAGQRTESIERALAERHAAELLDLLTQRDLLAAERDHLLQVLAHEVRQPLHNACGALQAAQGTLGAAPAADRGPATASEPVGRALQTLGNLQSVLDNALTGAMLLTRQQPLACEDVELDMVIDLALGDLPEGQRQRVAVQRQTSLRSLEVEPGLLRLALRNLLRNAFNHGGDGVAVTLTLREGHMPPTLELQITDDGRGIDERTLRRLQDGSDDRVSPLSSRGLGLYIVRRAMALHGGWLTLEANLPAGLRATLVLPLPAADDAAPGWSAS